MCVDPDGWRAFVKTRDDFLAAICTGALTLLGHEAACWCSNTELTINQSWESFKTAQAEELRRCKNAFLSGFFNGKRRMWGVICGPGWSEHRLYFVWLFQAGT